MNPKRRINETRAYYREEGEDQKTIRYYAYYLGGEIICTPKA